MYKITMQQRGSDEQDFMGFRDRQEAFDGFNRCDIIYDYKQDTAVFRLYHPNGNLIGSKCLSYFPHN